MNLLGYWVWENYQADLAEGLTYRFSSNQSRLHNDIDVGQSLWLVSGRRISREDGSRETGYILVAHLPVARKVSNPPGWKYGRYRVEAPPDQSRYFAAGGPDMSQLLLKLSFDPELPIPAENRIGQSLQTIRRLTDRDNEMIREWSNALSLRSSN